MTAQDPARQAGLGQPAAPAVVGGQTVDLRYQAAVSVASELGQEDSPEAGFEHPCFGLQFLSLMKVR